MFFFFCFIKKIISVLFMHDSNINDKLEMRFTIHKRMNWGDARPV